MLRGKGLEVGRSLRVARASEDDGVRAFGQLLDELEAWDIVVNCGIAEHF